VSVGLTTPRPGIALVTLSRPEALNTLNAELVAELDAVLDRVAHDESVRVVILTGEGRAFCAGLDLHGYDDGERVTRHGRALGQLTLQREIAGLTQRLHDLPQPVIAAVNGPAAGGGLALVCASDVRVAAEPAIFAVSFIRAGYSACDLGVSWLLPRIVGAGRAHELMLTGRRFSSAEALAYGLVTDVTAPAELLEAAYRIAEEITLNPPISVELTKQGMWLALETPSFDAAVEFENRQQVLTVFTEDQPEATRAFLEKRPPVYRRR
jgi:enoyl-CoA hydratase